MIGSMMFASINDHLLKPLSKKDDLESLLYTIGFIYFKRLPWKVMASKNINNRMELAKKK